MVSMRTTIAVPLISYLSVDGRRVEQPSYMWVRGYPRALAQESQARARLSRVSRRQAAAARAYGRDESCAPPARPAELHRPASAPPVQHARTWRLQRRGAWRSKRSRQLVLPPRWPLGDSRRGHEAIDAACRCLAHEHRRLIPERSRTQRRGVGAAAARGYLGLQEGVTCRR